MTYDEYMKSFNAKKVKNDMVNWIREWFSVNGNGCNAIIGISGGKDSAVVAALCVEALGQNRVIGVLMPNGVQADINDAQDVVKHLGIRSVMNVNIQDIISDTLKAIHLGFSKDKADMPMIFSEQTKINLPARIRMTILYAIAQTWDGRVANTCNKSEDWVGYSTRYGDTAGDFSPLANLTTDEVIAIGKACGIPDYLVEKTPSDGLCGKTDEDNLGFTYKKLNEYIRTGVCVDINTKHLIDQMHDKNLFKLMPIPSFPYANLPV